MSSPITETTANAAKPEAPAYRYWVLGLLFIAYTFNFIDRQIMGILNVPIQTELGATDEQMGLLGGLSTAWPSPAACGRTSATESSCCNSAKVADVISESARPVKLRRVHWPTTPAPSVVE